MEKEHSRLKHTWAHVQMANLDGLNAMLNSPLTREASGEDLIRRPEVSYEILTQIAPFAPAIEDKEATAIPAEFDYDKVESLSNEVRAKLMQHRPVTIGQASRISGITPAAISILLVNLKKQGMLKRGEL